MDADEKLTALKKAYADIILGISKEAAARVMASEKKAVRYHLDLKATKEEGVRMLMRLKQMMDAQISEAEAATLNQQKKIDELEAQLQEAEDIVRDLRDDLAEVQAELERMKSENSNLTVRPGNDRVEDIIAEDINCSYKPCEYLPPNKPSVAFGATVPYLGKRNECHKCYTKIVCNCGAYIRNRDLPSIILRGKDPGLSRNGCTQRIRACERNLLDRDLCLSQETGRVTEEKKDLEHVQGRRSSDSEAPASGGKILNELEKKLLAEIDLGNFQSFPQKRKRANRRKIAATPLAGKECSLLQNSDNLSAHSEAGDKAEPQTQLDITQASEDDPKNFKICESTTTVDGGVNEKVVPLGLLAELSESLPNDSKNDVGKDDVPSHSLETHSLDITKGHSSQPTRQREFKYTFQRKRKRQALVVSEINGSCATEKKSEDVQNVDLKQEKPKPSLLKESSRDHRRLAQVARQLISLSEQKCWR